MKIYENIKNKTTYIEVCKMTIPELKENKEGIVLKNIINDSIIAISLSFLKDRFNIKKL